MMTPNQLLELLESERQLHNYSASSPWYRSTRSAINSLELADQASNPKDRFSNLWLSVNHLYNPAQRSGEEENTVLSRWGTEIVKDPRVEASLKRIGREELETIKRAENHLLYHFQQRRDREGKVMLDTWLRQHSRATPSRVIQYLLGIGRDCRNATFHANVDPSNRNVVRALTALTDILDPFTRAAIEATIRHPIPGTTGRVPTYRGFLWPYFSNSNGFFSDYYLKEILPEQELGAFPEEASLDRLKEIKRSFRDLQDGLTDSDAQQTAREWLEPVIFPALDLEVVPGPELVGTEDVYRPDYVIPSPGQRGALAAKYDGKEAGKHLTALVFVLPWSASLDGTRPDADASDRQTALQWVQDALRATDVPWAILTNGQQLRLLRKEVAFQARSFVELDLTTILLRWSNEQDRHDANRAFRYGRCLLSGPSFTEPHRGERTRLEHVLEESRRHGAELGEELKQNVFRALEQLGEGFRYFLETHPEAREALRSTLAPGVPPADFMLSQPLLDKIYEGSLALMYRLLFLFYAESRDLLPMDVDLYREEYSLESIRDEVAERRDSPDERRRFVKGSHEMYGRLRELFQLVNGKAPSLVPVFNGGLFDPANHWILERCEVGDYFLAEAIDELSRTRLPWRTGLVKVTYRDLSVRHLGEIYEGILEYHAHIATEDHVVLERTSGGRKEEYYKPVAELAATEKQQLREWLEARQAGTPPPSRNKITGFKEKGSYFLVYGGRESKRRSSGSYYTPDYIVQYIVENTLGPLVRGENREGELKDKALSSDEILDLKVLDPAMGSGHFLVAALEYLATAYWEALNHEGKDDDGIMSDEEYIICKRRVAERCIYGVDINPLAVELGKLSIWLTTMDKERPLSFLNHHMKCGNSLLGAWIKDLGSLPGSKQSRGQTNLFEHHFKARVPLMVRDVFAIMERDTLSTDDVQVKKSLDHAVEATKAPFVNIANAWVASYFDESPRDYDGLLTDLNVAARRRSEVGAKERFFHWELEFPEVWFDRHGRTWPTPGFDACIGNPPYVRIELLPNSQKNFLKKNYASLNDRCDIYIGFIEHEMNLLSTQGRLGTIVSGQFITADYGSALRKLIEDHQHLDLLLDLEPLQVFANATTYPVVMGCSRAAAVTITGATALSVIKETPPFSENERCFEAMLEKRVIKQYTSLSQSPWVWVRMLSVGVSPQLHNSGASRIGELCNISSSLKSGKDSVLAVQLLGEDRGRFRVVLDGQEETVSKELWRRILRPDQLAMWSVEPADEVVFFPYEVKHDQFVLIGEAALRQTCGTTYEYLQRHRSLLEERRDSRKTWIEHGRPWYSLHRIGKPADYEPPRLLSAGEVKTNRFARSDTNELWPCARIIGISMPCVPISALQMYLNSEQVWKFMHASFPPKSGGYRGLSVGKVASIPCPPVESAIWKELEELAREVNIERIDISSEAHVRSKVGEILNQYLS